MPIEIISAVAANLARFRKEDPDKVGPDLLTTLAPFKQYALLAVFDQATTFRARHHHEQELQQAD